ncbi:hypothetical protein FVR03_06320 [Pontibacter qinzhouensis]|uniref:Uncharacterized protein n=2 Tax=Pontibacter qinzhouensis TaxID=2603253 RepID=A0A5C8KDH8_9BACT|nr:hypothetical protein FVR03_06320 [Pontibacter qinzhouensis]
MGRKVNLTDVIKCCEIRFGRGAAAHWTHSDFINLNHDIIRATKINISINTLKRIFGKLAVDEKYIPQHATIEALQKYCGYTYPEDVQAPVEAQISEVIAPIKVRKNIFLYIFILAIIGISGFAAWKLFKPVASFPAYVTLLKIEGTIPFTAVFDIMVPDNQDSTFVDFGDKSPLIHVRAEQKRVSHNYLYAGVFNVSLRTRRSVFAETTISVSSNKWIALSYHDQMRNHYYEIPAVRTGSDSLFNLTNRQLHSIGLDTVKRIFTRLYNFTPVNYFADDFTFETTFKNPPRRHGFSCNSTQFQISGINSMIRFKLSNPGCSSRVINVLSEQRFDGDKDDLSQFVLEQENWNTVKMINQNKQVSLFVNGELLFTGSYQKPLGEIKGLFIEFEGNGFVKNCDLKAGDGRSLYQF